MFLILLMVDISPNDVGFDRLSVVMNLCLHWYFFFYIYKKSFALHWFELWPYIAIILMTFPVHLFFFQYENKESLFKKYYLSFLAFLSNSM